VLSVVAYFNADWGVTDGGELVIYDAEGEQALQTVLPLAGTLVVFLSEEVPHEVCVARRDRYSIAGWYRSRATANPL
jgi:SM-20-related protein